MRWKLVLVPIQSEALSSWSACCIFPFSARSNFWRHLKPSGAVRILVRSEVTSDCNSSIHNIDIANPQVSQQDQLLLGC